MEFSGRIMKVLPAMEGTSQRTGNAWKIQTFIFEYFEQPTDRYSDKVVIETFDTKIMDVLQENLPVRIGFGHKTEERNGRYFNRITMYKFDVLNGKLLQDEQQPQMQATAAEALPPHLAQGAEQKKDDLPF